MPAETFSGIDARLRPVAADEAPAAEARLQSRYRLAHDLSNLLGSIIGYCWLVMETTPEDSESYIFLGRILAAGREAERLVLDSLTDRNGSD